MWMIIEKNAYWWLFSSNGGSSSDKYFFISVRKGIIRGCLLYSVWFIQYDVGGEYKIWLKQPVIFAIDNTNEL